MNKVLSLRRNDFDMSETLIRLADFRRINKISQSELGSALGVSGSFISLVEKGNSKMPLDKMQKLWSLIPQKHWDCRGLVPAWDRLNALDDAYLKSANLIGEKNYLNFINGFVQIISDDLREMIRCGQRGIDDNLAEGLVRVTSWPLLVSKVWLTEGIGVMFPPEDNLSDIDSDNEKASLMTILQKMAKKIEDIEEQLKEMRAFLVNKS